MPDSDQKSLLVLLKTHIQDYPECTIQDIYKLLYQGAMGPAHLIRDPEAAHKYLHQEWNAVPAAANERLTDPITPDGAVMRLHLRPLKTLLPEPEALWNALYNTGLNYPVSKELFLQNWRYMELLCRDNILPFTVEEYKELDAQAGENNYQAIHHSPRYREAYYPAYRIISRQEFDKLALPLEAKNG